MHKLKVILSDEAIKALNTYAHISRRGSRQLLDGRWVIELDSEVVSELQCRSPDASLSEAIIKLVKGATHE